MRSTSSPGTRSGAAPCWSGSTPPPRRRSWWRPGPRPPWRGSPWSGPAACARGTSTRRPSWTRPRRAFAQAGAAVTGLEAAIAKKTIRAPFDGRIAIRQVEVGQVVSPGTPVASLQSVDPIYVDFWLPQQALASLKVNQPVTVRHRHLPGRQLGRAAHHHQPRDRSGHPQRAAARHLPQRRRPAPPRHVRQRRGDLPRPAAGAAGPGHRRPVRPVRRLGLRAGADRRGRQAAGPGGAAALRAARASAAGTWWRWWPA